MPNTVLHASIFTLFILTRTWRVLRESERKAIRFTMRCYGALIVTQLSPGCPLVVFSFTMSSSAHLFCLQSSTHFIEKEDKNHFSCDLHKNHPILKPLILHLKNTDWAISSLKQLTIVEQNIVPLYHQVSQHSAAMTEAENCSSSS